VTGRREQRLVHGWVISTGRPRIRFWLAFGAVRAKSGQRRALHHLVDRSPHFFPPIVKWAGILVITLRKTEDAAGGQATIRRDSKHLTQCNPLRWPGQLIPAPYALERPDEFFLAEVPKDLPQEGHGNLCRRPRFPLLPSVFRMVG